MTSKGALGVCATLERRSGALARSALAMSRGYDDQRAAEVERVAATRRLLHDHPVWRADVCAFVHARNVRAEKIASALQVRSGLARLEAQAHAVEQRRWAQLRRGLELRAVRKASQGSLWVD